MSGLRTCVAVYAIDLGVTRPFNPRLDATSRRLEVVTDVSSLEADEGAVKM
jgi:hypothetical protein